MNVKNELAFKIFLKKMPSERFNDTTTKAYIGAAQDSIAIAELFVTETLKMQSPQENVDHLKYLDKESL